MALIPPNHKKAVSMEEQKEEGDLESQTVTESLKRNLSNNFLQQNLSSYRANLKLKHVLAYINIFCIFCGAFLVKLLVKAKDPIPSFHLVESTSEEYKFTFELAKDLDEDIFIYYQLEDFHQNALRVPVKIGNKALSFQEAIESPLGKHYVWIDIVEFMNLSTKSPVLIEFPTISSRFGRVNVSPIKSDSSLDVLMLNCDVEKFRREHFVRFCQWLFSSPFSTSSKVIAKVKRGLKKGNYSIVLRVKNLLPAARENFKFLLKPKSKVRVKRETKNYLIVMISACVSAQLTLIVLRFFFPKSQNERDLVEGYRKKMKFFLNS